jgi:FkbM family methyltransferase
MNSSQEDSSGETSASIARPRIIYDFGANNGENLPYYLKKADLVVAVEANPALCRKIEQRFAGEIAERRLRVENCVLAAEGADPEVYFYLHKRRDVLGQFPEPDKSVAESYNRVLLPSQPVMQIIQKHGPAYYIKIDLEGHDEVILRELFRSGVRPSYLSAEASSAQVFALLAGMGEYAAFKLVDGKTVAKKYRNHSIAGTGGSELYSFPPHSAGPFGEDIAGEWMSADDLFDLLAREGLGWKDIHATNLLHPAPVSRVKKRRHMLRRLRGSILAKLRPR